MSLFECLTPYLGPRGERLRHTVDAAVGYARARQSSDGGWVVAPEPRVLENALVLHCLARAGRLEGLAGAARARAWLEEHRPDAARDNLSHPVAAMIERWLWAVATGTPAEPLDLMRPELANRAFARRRLLMGVLSLDAGLGDPALGGPLRDALRLRVANPDAAKPWSAAEDAALYLILGDTDEELRYRALETLLRIQAQSGEGKSRGSIADNPISTALALWGATAGGAPPIADACFEYLSRARIDGTWRFCTTEVWDTALTARSLLMAGVGLELVEPARRYLRSRQNADGGWAYAPGRDSDVDTTAMALLVLDDADPAALRRGQAYLLGRRDGDGLWPTWNDKDDPVADDVVAHAVAALHKIGAPPSTYERAQLWLAQRFDERTGWRADWYDNRYYAAYEIGMAVRRQHPHTRRMASELIVRQDESGGFSPVAGARPSAAATGCALALLGEYVGAGHESFLRGVDYLLATQELDGGWPGPTGMYGPRPFVSDYAMQTFALSLLGVACAVRKLTRFHLVERRNDVRRPTSYLELSEEPVAATGAARS